MAKPKNLIWQISREYAGIAEAGGVKNVTCSLSEGLEKEGWTVRLFIPLYGCTSLWNIEDFHIISDVHTNITVNKTKYKIFYARGFLNGVQIILIIHSIFTRKMGVYTYTGLEEHLNPEHKRGEGHLDAEILSVVFQKAVLDYGRISSEAPSIIHCQDAAASLIPFLARNDETYASHYAQTRFILTIHNAGAGYHHSLGTAETAADFLQLPITKFSGGLLNGKIEPYLLAEPFARISTVSPWYAKDLMNPQNLDSDGLSIEFARRQTQITGITNGIDYDKYNPQNTNRSELPFAFNPLTGDMQGKYLCRAEFLRYYAAERLSPPAQAACDTVRQYGCLCADSSRTVYFSYHGRIVHQKGIDILTQAARIVLEKSPDARFIVTGQGNSELEAHNCVLARDFPGKYLYLCGYERSLARLCVAVSDFIVLPSIFEPCGLEDLIAQIYGTIPAAHACGGLKKILHNETGFLYDENTPQTLAALLLNLLEGMHNRPDFFSAMVKTSAIRVKSLYSWKKIIKEGYIPLYTT